MTKEEGELPEQPFTVHFDGKTVTAEVSDASSVYLSRGYGRRKEKENKITLNLHETLYLLEKGKIEVVTPGKTSPTFHEFLKKLEKGSENIWTEYVVFRDLRRRGYVVKEGFGSELVFRVFDRGTYETATAKFLVVIVVEGKNVDIGTLKRLITICRGLKRELIISVVDRRNEVVYYTSSAVDLKNV